MINHFLTVLSLLKWKGYIWLPHYLKRKELNLQKLIAEDRVIHIIVAVVDHFEPSRNEGQKGVQKVREWCSQYDTVAKKHCDSDGEYPKHTWFYRYDYPNYECIKILSEFVFKGFGEIEFHLHHGNDTPESFEKALTQGVDWFNRAGAMIAAGDRPQKRFAYIAGNWALDNGRRDPSLSGVNTELEILKKAGCYADFTFPAFGTNAQPAKVNSIYYAADTPAPKSYDTGVDMKVGGEACGDLLIFQGPLFIDWKNRHIEYASLENFTPFFPGRVDHWLSANIHVDGRPDWIFCKLHTHGMQSKDSFLNKTLEPMLQELERRFKQPPFKLHYVTAREAFNIAKAAEAGKEGNPSDFRNFEIKKPVNTKIFCNQPYCLKKWGDGRIIIEVMHQNSERVQIKFQNFPVREIFADKITGLDIILDRETVKSINIKGDGDCLIRYKNRTEREIGNYKLPLVDVRP